MSILGRPRCATRGRRVPRNARVPLVARTPGLPTSELPLYVRPNCGTDSKRPTSLPACRITKGRPLSVAARERGDCIRLKIEADDELGAVPVDGLECQRRQLRHDRIGLRDVSVRERWRFRSPHAQRTAHVTVGEAIAIEARP